MYYRTDMTHRVDWTPDHAQQAEKAMSDVIPDFDSWDGNRREVSTEQAEEIKKKYREYVAAEVQSSTK
jgi:hypothetical protein